MDPIVFVTLINTSEQIPYARMLAASLRSFGGRLKESPILLFAYGEAAPKDGDFEDLDVQILALHLPTHMGSYYFGGKAAACKQAEEMAAGVASSLVWMGNDCLFLQTPELLQLDPGCDAAVRPVHIRNIGLLYGQEPDRFWKAIFEKVGLDKASMTVQAFIGGEKLQAYFNSHIFAVNPRLGLMQRWYTIFEALILDATFQENTCADTMHQVFLHQAVLSALLAQEVGEARIRVLPEQYSYPYNLHERVPEDRRARRMDDMVCIAHEYRSLDPDQITDIEISEPLRAWLKKALKP